MTNQLPESLIADRGLAAKHVTGPTRVPADSHPRRDIQRPVTNPNFLFIGPDKTGSSWLFEVLRSHPQCFVPDCKDIYFFDRYYDRGIGWYLSFFKNAPTSARAVGELSHDYLFSEQAADRIAHDLPGAKLMTCLRDPADRTFSQYLYLVRSGRTRVPFEAALDAFPELVDNSLYHRHLSRYFDRFPRERILILLFDHLRANPLAFAHQVFDYLGVSREVEVPVDRRVREASRPRSFLLARLAKWGAIAARDLGHPRLVGIVKHSRLARWMYPAYAPGSRPRMAPATRDRLHEVFARDLEALEGLLGTELPGWRKAPP